MGEEKPAASLASSVEGANKVTRVNALKTGCNGGAGDVTVVGEAQRLSRRGGGWRTPPGWTQA